MKRYGWVLAVGLVAGIGAGAQAQTAAATDATVCDVVNHPKQFDGKTVRVKGVVQADFDSFVMRGDSCSSVLWLSYPAGDKDEVGAGGAVDIAVGRECQWDAGYAASRSDARAQQGL